MNPGVDIMIVAAQKDVQTTQVWKIKVWRMFKQLRCERSRC